MIEPAPYRPATGLLCSDLEMRSTFIFDMTWPGPFRPVLYAANPNREAPDIDETTGIFYPPSRLRKDAFGRTAADVRASKPSEEEWLF